MPMGMYCSYCFQFSSVIRVPAGMPGAVDGARVLRSFGSNWPVLWALRADGRRTPHNIRHTHRRLKDARMAGLLEFSINVTLLRLRHVNPIHYGLLKCTGLYRQRAAFCKRGGRGFCSPPAMQLAV